LYKIMESIISAYLVQEKRMDFLANNLANVNTAGFKEDRPIFQVNNTNGAVQPAQPESVQVADTGPSKAIRPVSYLNSLRNNSTVFAGVKTDYAPGQLLRTGNKLDLALRGSGFFAVETPEGVRYTRNGRFTLNDEGLLVSHEGFPVLGDNGGAITIEKEDVVVRADGEITSGADSLGKLMIADLPSSGALIKAGGSLFASTAGPLPEKDSEGAEVAQGFLESSNVNVVKDMIMLIEVSRAYESYQKVVHSLNEVLTRSINEISRLT